MAATENENNEGAMGFLKRVFNMVLMWILISQITKNYMSPKSGPSSLPSTSSVQSSHSKPKNILKSFNSDLYVEKDRIRSSKPVNEFEMSGQNPFGDFPARMSDGTLLAPHSNLFPDGISFSLRVYLSEEEEFHDFHDESQLVWYVPDLSYDFQEQNEREHKVNVTISPHMLNNGSMYLHTFFTRSDASPNPKDPFYHRLGTIHSYTPLIVYRPPIKVKKVRNLLSGKVEEESNDVETLTKNQLKEDEDKVEDYVPYWKPSLRFHLIHDFTVFKRGTAPPPFIAEHLHVDLDSGNYFPIVYMNEFWSFRDEYIQINNTITELPLNLMYYPLSMHKFALYSQMDKGFHKQEQQGTSTELQTDNMKRMFVETNPILLGITIIVSILHMLFDFLAFKNDVNFWRKRKSMEGLSLRTVGINVFFQLIIFLYLMDNETSYMILFSSGIGVLIECWKLKKVIWLEKHSETGKWTIHTAKSYTNSPTAKYDAIAVEHLSYIMYPLVVGYACYTLVYSEHKSWYSWILSSLTGFVYVFGFIMMTPQLYINYRLKSVAHLPWRAMIYKSLNTFIDDLFAFVIKMPMLHRISCFRDDLIFFIYLYQRWIYPVDKKRINEFGQQGEDDDANDNDKEVKERETEKKKMNLNEEKKKKSMEIEQQIEPEPMEQEILIKSKVIEQSKGDGGIQRRGKFDKIH